MHDQDTTSRTRTPLERAGDLLAYLDELATDLRRDPDIPAVERIDGGHRWKLALHLRRLAEDATELHKLLSEAASELRRVQREERIAGYMPPVCVPGDWPGAEELAGGAR